MNKIVQWQGLENSTFENLNLSHQKNGIDIISSIRGNVDGIAIYINYEIRTNLNWEVLYADIRANLNGENYFNLLKKDENNEWILNGKSASEFSDCDYLDIALTPFTNSLPIKRLKLNAGEEKTINVIYFDIIEQKITRVQQLYKRLTDTTYLFQNVPNNFEAVITVDDDGLVVDYPGLFLREE